MKQLKVEWRENGGIENQLFGTHASCIGMCMKSIGNLGYPSLIFISLVYSYIISNSKYIY